MKEIDRYRNELSRRKKKLFQGTGKSFLVALVVQLLLLGATFFMVVMDVGVKEEPAFSATETIYLPKKRAERAQKVAAYQKAASGKEQTEKVSVKELLEHATPDLSALPSIPYESSFLEGNMLDALSTASSEFSTEFTGETFRSERTKLDFMGVETEAERLLVLFDISSSVKTKLEKAGSSMEEVRKKTKDLLTGLDANTVFGLLQFSRKYDLFMQDLVPATKKNKEKALQWLDSKFRTDGKSRSSWKSGTPNGVELVLKRAFEMQPDVIFLLSDGDFQRNPLSGRRGGENVSFTDMRQLLDDLQQKAVERCVLNCIGVKMKADHRRWLSTLCTHWGGQLRCLDD